MALPCISFPTPIVGVAVGEDLACRVSFAMPAICCDAGQTVKLADCGVQFGADSATVYGGITWKNGTNTITSYTPSAAGVFPLTASYGGRISLTVSFLAVFVITLFGTVLGGIAGYFGGFIDNLIMRICDVLICLPGIPILLIISTILTASDIDAKYRIYLLMIYLTLFSWPGTARLVRGQILSLREQEYMVAAEAMGYSTSRKIFKHLVPNVMPQLIVQMSLSLGSMILYEALPRVTLQVKRYAPSLRQTRRK